MRSSRSAALLAAFVLLALAPTVGAQLEYQVGVTPLVTEAGNLTPGTTVPLQFAITTRSREPLTVQFAVQSGSLDFFKKPEYAHLLPEASEQATAAWMELLDDSVDLTPAPDASADTRTARPINLLLHIPADAEPGIHTVVLRPEPQVPAAEAQAVGFLAVTQHTILFRVPGKAVREAKALDIAAQSVQGDRLPVSTAVLNTGTVSIRARANPIILDVPGAPVSFASVHELVPPGALVPLTAFLPAGVPPGSYGISATVDYTTGSAEAKSAIQVPENLALPAPEAAASGPVVLPAWLWLLPFLIVALVAFVLWRRRRR